MSERFFVSDEVVNQVEDGFLSIGENVDYVRDILLSMKKKHPNLHLYTKSVADSQPHMMLYATGVALTYDALQSQLIIDGKNITIDEMDMELYDINIADYFTDQRWLNFEWRSEQLEAGNRPITDSTWLFDKLESKAGGLLGFLVMLGKEIGSYEQKSSFYRGISDVAGPILGKIEANETGEYWFPQG